MMEVHKESHDEEDSSLDPNHDIDDPADETSSKTPSVTDSRPDEVGEVKKLIQDETRVVLAWRLVVIVAMLLVSTAVTTATYMFVSEEEDSEFKTSFSQFASTIVDFTFYQTSSIRSSCSDFSDQLTAASLEQGAEWPFFTFEYFDVLAKNVQKQTGTIGVWMLPLVTEEQKGNWTVYSIMNKGWFKGLEFSPVIYSADLATGELLFEYPGPYGPVWQIDPLPANNMMNFDFISDAGAGQPLKDSIDHSAILGEGVFTANFPYELITPIWPQASEVVTDTSEPFSAYVQAIYDNFNTTTRRLVAAAQFTIPWGSFFTNAMPDSVRGIHLVLDSTCDTSMTWEFQGSKAVFMGVGDLHDPSYDSLKYEAELDIYGNKELARSMQLCSHTLRLYPTSSFEESYTSNRPLISTVVVGAVFILIISAFIAYDSFQRRRNTKVILNAANSNALVMSLFPSNIRDRLLTPVDAKGKKSTGLSTYRNDKNNLKSFLDADQDAADALQTEGGTRRSIADFFLETTIMFADITNFTAWSSVREPADVFTLLETVFSALDRIAKRRGVYKVETVGDCYVAVAGLPIPRKDHAMVMAKFARDTLFTVQDLVKKLELTLGPDTGELGIRIGLHSGPVTAGVLRGERARFQLFGDTMNTAARMESTGQKNRIHVSEETAELLRNAGKGHWVYARQELVQAKGKGTMRTFWIDTSRAGDYDVNKPGAGNSSTTGSSVRNQSENGDDREKLNDLLDGSGAAAKADKPGQPINDSFTEEQNKTRRLIDWQVDMFASLLKQMVARRAATSAAPRNSKPVLAADYELKASRGKISLDEVKEIIHLPDFDARAAARQNEDLSKVDLGPNVIRQLRTFITTVASMYRPNHFHNFAHACHVTMSVKKLLSRIVLVPPELQTENETSGQRTNGSNKKGNLASSLHDNTYGITSDPLTQFALVFSALIHDVDHRGIPNETLIKEERVLALMYRNKSVAEQHSIDVAWDLLQDDEFKELRACIYSTKAEFDHFRQLVVQAVLATDIVDKELKTLRNARWESAFAETEREENPRDTIHRKATIVIEHLIQASDVAHTMQHWHVYRKWNENFFRECYQAFQEGRAEKDPSSYWYKGELGFFDFYIIPLAKKLKICGVFGVASDEYLNYALKNRQEWEDRGREVVEEMLHSMRSSMSQNTPNSPSSPPSTTTAKPTMLEQSPQLGGAPGSTSETVEDSEDENIGGNSSSMKAPEVFMDEDTAQPTKGKHLVL